MKKKNKTNKTNKNKVLIDIDTYSVTSQGLSLQQYLHPPLSGGSHFFKKENGRLIWFHTLTQYTPPVATKIPALHWSLERVPLDPS